VRFEEGVRFAEGVRFEEGVRFAEDGGNVIFDLVVRIVWCCDGNVIFEFVVRFDSPNHLLPRSNSHSLRGRGRDGAANHNRKRLAPQSNKAKQRAEARSQEPK
jgi:hypothetical protein